MYLCPLAPGFRKSNGHGLLSVLTRMALFPHFRLPSFSSCIARLTDRCVRLPYLVIMDSVLCIDAIAKPQNLAF
jgi:hypothetical protein